MDRFRGSRRLAGGVKKAGGKIEVPVHDNPENGLRAAIVAAPEGHLIEIIQMIEHDEFRYS